MVDILQMIFELLQLTPELIYKYSAVQDQILWLLFVPHIILFLFLFSFGYWMAAEHHGLRYLVTIAGYVVIVMTGWYGSIIVPIVDAFFLIMLGSAFVFFIISRVFHPAPGKGGTGFLSALAKHGTQAVTGESGVRLQSLRERRELEAEKAMLIKSIAEIEGSGIKLEREVALEVTRMRRRVREIDRELKGLLKGSK